ncbi:MAG: alpha/beta fold hydrolase [Actinomycetota bacterium]|nr:alpha/beta fold hydrolase [Actinomycetota bacterium]
MSDPSWLDRRLFPFASRFVEVEGCRVHYVDEGDGPVLLMLHGNPTWSFLYRELVAGLRDRFRCIAPDHPGFGLSAPRRGYGFTPAEHAAVLERFVEALGLEGVTLMVQDWGGPIGFAAATRAPERFAAFVVGNTWAWPMRENRGAQLFSRMLGSGVGRRLVLNRNLFVERILPGGMRRRLPPEVMDHYRGPFPTPASRVPVAVLPGAILGAAPFLAEVESGLPRLRDRPALVLWPDADVAFGEPERRRWETVFPRHRTVVLEGAGHFFQEDAPAESVAAIRAWAGER